MQVAFQKIGTSSLGMRQTDRNHFEATPASLPSTSSSPVRKMSRPALVNLASLDLNLLVSLEVLLEERNVTHAAQRVGLSQPAMSRALSRLRGMFNDDLLVRSSSGLIHTPRGVELHSRLPGTMHAIRHLIANRSGTAERWQQPLRIAIADHQAYILLPHLLQRLGGKDGAPEIIVEPLANAFKRLEQDEIELAVGAVGFSAAGFYQRTLYVDDYVCLVRRGHPALSGDWNEAAFFGQRHIVADPGTCGEANCVFDPLARLLPERSRVVLASTMSAPMVVADSDLLLTVPRRVAEKITALLPLEIVELPVKVEPHRMMLVWHERSHRQPSHVALRLGVASAAAQLGIRPE